MADKPRKDEAQEYIQVTYTQHRPYRWAAGKYLTKLYYENKFNKRMISNRCRTCKEIVWPPAQICGRCRVEAGDDWEVLSDKGTVLQSTYINYALWDPHKGGYLEEEYPYATMRLDGGIYWVARLQEKDVEKLVKGMRVQAVWKENEEDRGRGLDEDVLYFKTIDQ